MPTLVCHPDTPPLALQRVEAQFIAMPRERLLVRYRLTGIEALEIAPFDGRGRQDELWRKTCGELFLTTGEAGYREFNFAPTGRWAAYDFRDYRKAYGEYEPLEMPEIDIRVGETMAVLDAGMNMREIHGFSFAGLTMVVEETGGHMSYWALAHGSGEPDFHDRSGFTLDLREGGAA